MSCGPEPTGAALFSYFFNEFNPFVPVFGVKLKNLVICGQM
jgi:hypothetical protein